MSHTRPPHPDAAYVALPNAPDAAFAGHHVVPTALGEEDDAEDDVMSQSRRSEAFSLDPKIRWILFMLGAAVLLPWNGVLALTR
jgi:hypothetical protein